MNDINKEIVTENSANLGDGKLSIGSIIFLVLSGLGIIKLAFDGIKWVINKIKSRKNDNKKDKPKK